MPKHVVKREGKGTQRSWDREVGYGTAPDWYLQSHGYSVTIETHDINHLPVPSLKNWKSTIRKDKE